MDKILVICGPTATGKTRLGLEFAKLLDGEIVSADSRQVYVGKDVITGKDIPPGSKPHVSNIKWRDRYLKYYQVFDIRIWLYDIVYPNEPFNIAFWKESADLVIPDIHARGKLPIVVGGTGLYIKSLSVSLSQISIPPQPLLRDKLAKKTPGYLFNYLNKIDSDRAQGLNASDRRNPRRLIRAIEVALSKSSQNEEQSTNNDELFMIGLTAPRDYLYALVDHRIAERINAGAASEDPDLAADPDRWKTMEHRIIRHQLTWFNKQPDVVWFDITRPSWKKTAIGRINEWYNKPNI